MTLLITAPGGKQSPPPITRDAYLVLTAESR
jgi:hypothetical protein